MSFIKSRETVLKRLIAADEDPENSEGIYSLDMSWEKTPCSCCGAVGTKHALVTKKPGPWLKYCASCFVEVL